MVVSGDSGQRENADLGSLLMANKGAHSLSTVDPRSGNEVAKAPVGAETGHEVAVSRNGRTGAAQGTRDSDSCQAREEAEGVEGQVRQDLQSAISDFRMRSQTRFPRLLEGVCAERAELDKDEFWLHKFRSTFATRCLWAGVDLRTVQQWLGHSDMESTMRYLSHRVAIEY